MRAYENTKVYNAGGYLVESGVKVVIMEDRVTIGGTTHPIAELTIDHDKRTIESQNGWSVAF